MGAHARFTFLREGSALVCEGAIDERADLTTLVEHARGGRLVLDLAGISFINSLGVRAWCQLQQLARSIDLQLELRRVSERLVHQLNIVPATRAASIVTSFYAPYHCDHCGNEEDVLVDVARDGVDLARHRPPERMCEECRAMLIFSEPPELYFAFLTS
jgi:anti-anti-sigma regulatory factor